jgi:hypothetical protein
MSRHWNTAWLEGQPPIVPKTIASSAQPKNQPSTSGKREARPDRALTKPNEQKPENDSHLARIVAAWSELLEHIRAAILALVGTAGR